MNRFGKLASALASIRAGNVPTDAEIIADYRGTDFTAAALERCIDERGYVYELRADLAQLHLNYPVARWEDGEPFYELDYESIPVTGDDIARLSALLGVVP